MWSRNEKVRWSIRSEDRSVAETSWVTCHEATYIMKPRFWLTCLVLLLNGVESSAQENGAIVKPGDPGQRQANYLQLNRKIFTRHADPDSEKMHIEQEDKVAEIRSQLHDLMVDEIDSTLNGPASSSTSVKTALMNLQGAMTLPMGDMTNTPYADSFVLNGVNSTAVAYAILQGGDTIPDTQAYLEIYDRSNGHWERKTGAPTQSDFRHRTFYVSQIDSGVPGEAWFLAWGMTIGNPGTPVNVRLYAFDGNAVRTVWKRDDLIRGNVSVSKNSVTLDYDREYKSSDPDNRVHETLHVSPSGLQ